MESGQTESLGVILNIGSAMLLAGLMPRAIGAADRRPTPLERDVQERPPQDVTEVMRWGSHVQGRSPVRTATDGGR